MSQDISIRPAHEHEAGLVLQFIRDLARYEHLEHKVVATEEDVPANVPAPVFGSRGLVFKSVSAGMAHACGLTSAGDVYCWGTNKYGQLGRGSKENSVRPALVPLQP